MGGKIRYCPLLLAAGLVVYLLLSGRRPAPPLLHTPVNEQQIKDFFYAKEAQARQLVSIEKRELPPEIWPYFAAGKKGDWATVTNLYGKMANRTYDFKSDRRIKVDLQSMSWIPITETYCFYLQCTQSDSKFALALGEAIMRLVPPGSIYFGDTDTGRFVPTALCRDHAKGDPFFILTQNVLADNLYLSYLDNMYGKKIQIPSEQDTKVAFDEYMLDAINLMQSGKLQPEEGLQIMKYKAPSIAIINARLSEIMFERNTGRDFFVCEDHPSEWMYPHLTPHGPIMKVNRDKLNELKPDTIQQDRDYWEKSIRPFIGNWLKEATSLTEICAFTEKTYVHQDYAGFSGDTNCARMTTFGQLLPEYQPAAIAWSKCRSAIADVYVWRMNNCTRKLQEIQTLPIAEQSEKRQK